MPKVYDSDKVTVTVDSRYITGFADGSFVQAEKDEESFSTKVGAQGDVDVAKTNNSLGTITLTLSQTSPSLAYIIAKAKTMTPFPVWVNYNYGGVKEKAGGTQALIKKSPSKTFSGEIENREVEIQVFDYTEE